MEITVNKRSIGSDYHLSFDGKGWRWVTNPDQKSLLWGFSSPRDLRSAAKCLNEKVQSILDTPWGKAHEIVGGDLSETPWSICMPQAKWRSFVKNLVERLWCVFSDESNSYYISTHIRNRELLDKLVQPLIDRSKVESLRKELDNGLRANIEKFLPEREGFARKSVYSLSNTVTGRMTIVDGPNVLTLSRKHRKIIKSRYTNGTIVEVDIQSAEPRVALALFGKKVEGDIYEDMMRSIDVKIPRDVAKVATLSAIYGASSHSLKGLLPESTSAVHVLDSVREYFGVRMMEKVVNEDHQKYGMIFNTHGRKIFSEIPSVNHLVQSSTVDVSFDVFSVFMSRLESQKIKFKPLYLIHDAIILDIPRESRRKIDQTLKESFLSSKIETEFYLKIKEIK